MRYRGFESPPLREERCKSFLIKICGFFYFPKFSESCFLTQFLEPLEPYPQNKYKFVLHPNNKISYICRKQEQENHGS